MRLDNFHVFVFSLFFVFCGFKIVMIGFSASIVFLDMFDKQTKSRKTLMVINFVGLSLSPIKVKIFL